MTKKMKKDYRIQREKIAYGVKLQWVIDNLTSEEKEHADRLAPSPEEIQEFLMACVDNGLEIKCGWDNWSKCYNAIAIGSWHGFPSASHATTGRSGGSVGDALLMLWYRVAIKAEYDLSSVATEDEARDIRG